MDHSATQTAAGGTHHQQQQNSGPAHLLLHQRMSAASLQGNVSDTSKHGLMCGPPAALACHWWPPAAPAAAKAVLNFVPWHHARMTPSLPLPPSLCWLSTGPHLQGQQGAQRAAGLPRRHLRPPGLQQGQPEGAADQGGQERPPGHGCLHGLCAAGGLAGWGWL
jgi:hypothetical protein